MNRPQMVIGIDPGVTGAIAGISGSVLSVWDMPIRDLKAAGRKRPVYDAKKLVSILENHRDAVVFLENPGFAPSARKGEKSSFARGSIATVQLTRCVGIVEGICSAMGITLHLVSPVAWKRSVFGKTKTDKKESIRMVKRLYPSAPLTKAEHHNRAEAILIAHYGGMSL